MASYPERACRCLSLPLSDSYDRIRDPRIAGRKIKVLPPQTSAQVPRIPAHPTDDIRIHHGRCDLRIMRATAAIDVRRPDNSIDVVDDHKLRVDIDRVACRRPNRVIYVYLGGVSPGQYLGSAPGAN